MHFKVCVFPTVAGRPKPVGMGASSADCLPALLQSSGVHCSAQAHQGISPLIVWSAKFLVWQLALTGNKIIVHC